MTNHGRMIAAAAAGLLAGGMSLSARADDKAPAAKTHCSGANACSGKGACKSATNACAGKNACKGKGWIETASAKECTDKGGKVVDPKAPAPKK
ncbi:MAG TPA: hypothetical protein VHE30_03560 [Polyangiaceae bacterium]|nr:hypothetical protein [Polyangiaceae bacterium]